MNEPSLRPPALDRLDLPLPPEPTSAALTAAGGDFVTHADAHLVCGGLVLAGGEISRLTDYETGLVERDAHPTTESRLTC